MILSDIEERLKKLDTRVCYGIIDNAVKQSPVWDCIVFGRSNIKYPSNKLSASDYFDVLIIRENYIPDGLDTEIIQTLTALDGVRLAGDTANFDYIQKPNTDTVIEMLTISFVRARKNV